MVRIMLFAAFFSVASPMMAMEWVRGVKEKIAAMDDDTLRSFQRVLMFLVVSYKLGNGESDFEAQEGFFNVEALQTEIATGLAIDG